MDASGSSSEKQKSIKISVENWRRIMRIKIDMNLRSIDEVLSYLLKVAEKGGC